MDRLNPQITTQSQTTRDGCTDMTDDEPYIVTKSGYKTPAHLVLRVMAFELFGDYGRSLTKARYDSIERVINRLMQAARLGGFTRGDLLLTMLSKQEDSERTQRLSREACKAAGAEATDRFLDSLRRKNSQ